MLGAVFFCMLFYLVELSFFYFFAFGVYVYVVYVDRGAVVGAERAVLCEAFGKIVVRMFDVVCGYVFFLESVNV